MIKSPNSIQILCTTTAARAMTRTVDLELSHFRSRNVYGIYRTSAQSTGYIVVVLATTFEVYVLPLRARNIVRAYF